LAKLHGAVPVNEALERCATYGRFGDGDLASVLAHQQTATVIPLPARASEERSLQTSTRSWQGSGDDRLRWDITAQIEDRQTERLVDGSALQLVSVILSDPEPDPDDPPTRRRPPAWVVLRPSEARELAFCLLERPNTPNRSASHDRQTARPAAPARRARPAPAPPSPALRSACGAGGARHRHHSALGARRSPARAPGRGGRRPHHATIAMRRRASGLPAGKTFDAWKQQASVIPKPTQNALRTLEWVDRAEVLVVCGPSGTGKSHFIEALGHLAIDQGRTVAWHTLETLAALLRRHRADDSITKAIAKLIRSDLILIDDVGLLPVSADAADALFRVIDAAYEKRSIAISSNIHPSGLTN
jgi:DNA replication protein DnaC